MPDTNQTIEDLQAEIARLRAALELHDAIARADEKDGADVMWTDQFREANEATRQALTPEKQS